MANELANILQNNPAIIQTGLDADTLAVAGGVSSGPKRISIRGGVFRKLVGNKEVGSIEDRHMNVVIVKMAHTAQRMYYAQAYQEGVQTAPSCWSSDSRTPDADVENPPATSCESCPMSIRNSAAGGGSSCRLSWRIAVVLPDDPSGDVLALTLPSTSCWQKEENGRWGFRPYIQMLANNNVSASRIITKMQFDSKSATPKLVFSPVGAVNPQDYDVIEKQAQSEIATQAVTLTIYKPQEETEVAQAKDEPVKLDASTLPQSDVEAEQPATIQESSAPKKEAPTDVSDIVKKWSVKS